MNNFWESAGLIAICFLMIYVFKKTADHYDCRHSGYYRSEKVSIAAKEFADGASVDVVKGLLAGCLDFDEEDIEDILSGSLLHRGDQDGGYGAFIKEVNKTLGADVYSETPAASC
jgi:hypothetical protein